MRSPGTLPALTPRLLFAMLLLLQLTIGLYGINQPVRWGHQGYHVAEHGLGGARCNGG